MDIIINTDGGCDPNPGPGGAGVYIEHVEKGRAVEEIKIYRAIPVTTNNRAELTAAHIALDWIVEHDLTKVTINIDSAYVRDPIVKGWLKKRIANNWERDDGTEYPNTDLWKPFSDLLARVNKVCKIKWVKVKGHSGHHGNDQADILATIGTTLAKTGSEEHNVTRKSLVTETGEPIKLEKFKMSPLLQGPRFYFHSRDKLRTDKEGRYIYYTGTHGKEDGDVGKRTHEALHCVTLLKEADPAIQYIVDEHQKVNTNRLGTIATIKLDTACTSSKYIKLRNTLLSCNPERSFLELKTSDGLMDLQGTLISRDISPPILGFTCLDTFNYIESVLMMYLEGNERIRETDLTDVLYDVGVVGKGKDERKKYTLKKDITTSTKTLDLPISTFNGNRTIKLTLGHCLPKRNTLSAIAKDTPSVKAITWDDGGKSFRLAFIMETTEGVSLWTAFYSALYFTD